MTNPIWLVAQMEFATHLRKPSFLLTTLAVPLIALVVALLARQASLDDAAGAPALPEIPGLESGAPEVTETRSYGIVDRAGLIETIPTALEAQVQLYADGASAEAALRAGEVDAYYLIPADWLERGEVERVARRLEPFPEDTALVEWLLTLNLLSGTDAARAALLRDPLPDSQIEEENIGERAADRAGGEDAGALAFTIAYTVAMLIYTTTFASASFLLQSVTTEKENRMMEVLLTSIRPLELLAGKVIGLGLLGLGQTALWGAAAVAVAQVGLTGVSLGMLGIGWRLTAMLLLYYVLGYGVYSTIMAGIGALVPSAKESGPVTMVVVIPAIIPLTFLINLVENPHGPLAVALSLIPLTAPITMMIRLVQGGVPPWQLLASIAIMVLAIPLLLRGAARLFRAQTLLASESFSMRRAWAVLRG